MARSDPALVGLRLGRVAAGQGSTGGREGIALARGGAPGQQIPARSQAGRVHLARLGRKSDKSFLSLFAEVQLC